MTANTSTHGPARRRQALLGIALGILGGIGCASGTIAISVLGGASQGAFLRSLTPYLIVLTSIGMVGWITWTTVRDGGGLGSWLRALAIRGTPAGTLYATSLLAVTSIGVVV